MVDSYRPIQIKEATIFSSIETILGNVDPTKTTEVVKDGIISPSEILYVVDSNSNGFVDPRDNFKQNDFQKLKGHLEKRMPLLFSNPNSGASKYPFINEHYNRYLQHGELRLKDAELSKDATIKGILFKKGTKIHFYDNDTLPFTGEWSATLSQDTTIKGILFKKNTKVQLGSYGDPESGILSRDTSINGILFKRNTELLLYSNGNPRHGTLSQDTIINDILFKKGTTVSFYGVKDWLLAVHLSQNTTFQGISFKKSESIPFLVEIPKTT